MDFKLIKYLTEDRAKKRRDNFDIQYILCI